MTLNAGQLEAGAVDWPALLRPHDRLVCSHMTSEPVALLRSLCAAAPAVPLSLMLGVPFTLAAAEAPAHVSLSSFGAMGSAAAIGRGRALQIGMAPYGRCAEPFEQPAVACDVALVSLAQAPDGRLMLGASHGYIVEAARQARHVVAEINAQAPCVPGAAWPEDIPLGTAVATDYPLAQAAPVRGDAVDLLIARHVAALVPDGACLQVGLGAMPSAVLAALSAHRHLGVHSGMLTDALHDLIVSGAIDHSRKPVGSRHAVVGSVYGHAALYRFSHLNPDVSLREPRYTHGAAVIASLPDFVAINGAIEVDLLGQVNAEAVPDDADGLHHGLRYVGGIGGLNDFVRGARAAPRGRSIIALPSRTRPGAAGRARIVASLSGPATVAAMDADIVVTEHGVAHLRDADLGDRVRRMLAIADPSDREALERTAHARGLLR
ncbi:MAG: acetyl-CoA hydrolase/transferase C-terminal domain-containing protein [Pseudomonadota bacterium]